MASYATAFIIGRLARDPELRVTPQGKAICAFSVAVNRKTRTEDDVSFFDIEAWEKTAELCAKFLAKGRNVMIAGRLKQDTWTDKTTQQKRSKIKIIANEVQFLDPKPADAPQTGADDSVPPATSSASTHSPAGCSTPGADDDVPF